MKKFSIVKSCIGYITKRDKTNTYPNVLVSPSQNVLINDEEKVEIRKGYTVYGADNSNLYPVESSYDWQTSSDEEINLRSWNDRLEFYDSNLSAWTKLSDGFSAVDFVFTTWWDTTEGIDLLLFVNGSDKIWDWSGGIAVLASATANTITKSGATTWAQERFLTAGTRQVIINGTTYTYTGGETTTTLTGVTPNPSTEAADSTVFQAIRLNDNEPANGTVNDIISVLNNQIYVGSNESQEVYVSKNTDFKDFSFSSPRIPGEGALLTLDNVARGFARQGDKMYISAGRDDWYKTEFAQLDVGGTLTETLNIKKLNTSTGQAAQSQELIAEIGNTIAFITFEPALRILGSIENIESPQSRAVSNPIKPDFDDEDFTNGNIKFHKNRIYVSAPNNDTVYINEIREDADGNLKRLWQPPQVLPVRNFAIMGDDLYGHSNAVPETYKLFDGTNDDGNSISAKAAFSYRNYGRRANLKNFDEWFSEGYISANTILELTLNFDFDGYTQKVEKEIDGGNEDILYEVIDSASLGDQPIGDSPLGDEPEESLQIPKFRIIHDISISDFFELQAIYSTDTIDAQWELMAFGGSVSLSKAEPVSIKI